MRPTSLLLSFAVAAASLMLPAAARLNYYKGLTTVADLETLRVLDDEGACVWSRRLARVQLIPPIDSSRDRPLHPPRTHAQAASGSTRSWPLRCPTRTGARPAPSTSLTPCASHTSSSTFPAQSSRWFRYVWTVRLIRMCGRALIGLGSVGDDRCCCC